MKKLIQSTFAKTTQKWNFFFFSEEFFSTLKGQSANKADYNNSKKLFILLKMRNLSDLNDLCNVMSNLIKKRF